MSNHCVYGMRNISNLCERKLSCIYCTNTHTQTPCGNNKCVYDGDLCFLYYFRILSGFETIINSISFSLSLLNILIILTLSNKAAVLLLLNIYSVIFKLTSCSYTNMQNLES